MLLYRGGHTVPKGTYWSVAMGDRIDIAGEAVLPGDTGTVFVKMPQAAILLIGPIVGLLYAIFLPFIGIAMTVSLIGRKLFGRAVHRVVQIAVKSTTFGWKPIEVYLDGRQRRIRDPRTGGKCRKT